MVTACVELVRSMNPPLPVVFKQHPRDPNDYTELATEGELLFLDARTNLRTHEIFASGACAGVISINSNTLHEATVWKVPAVALGKLVWGPDCGTRPYPDNLGDLDPNQASSPTTVSYLHWLLRNQWTLSDFLDPVILSHLVDRRGYCVPGDLRPPPLGMPPGS